MPVSQEWIEKRKAQLDVFKQMEEARQAQREQQEAEHAELYARAMAYRAALARGERPPAPVIPTLEQLGEQWQQEQLAAEQKAEEARIAALSPREIWLSTLSWQERQHVEKWEAVNKQPYPFAQQ